jgi:hypothetical protein
MGGLSMTELKTSNIKMVLKADLSNYHPDLKMGTEGIIVSLHGPTDVFAKVNSLELELETYSGARLRLPIRNI